MSICGAALLLDRIGNYQRWQAKVVQPYAHPLRQLVKQELGRKDSKSRMETFQSNGKLGLFPSLVDSSLESVLNRRSRSIAIEHEPKRFKFCDPDKAELTFSRASSPLIR